MLFLGTGSGLWSLAGVFRPHLLAAISAPSHFIRAGWAADREFSAVREQLRILQSRRISCPFESRPLVTTKIGRKKQPMQDRIPQTLVPRWCTERGQLRIDSQSSSPTHSQLAQDKTSLNAAGGGHASLSWNGPTRARRIQKPDTLRSDISCFFSPINVSHHGSHHVRQHTDGQTSRGTQAHHHLL